MSYILQVFQYNTMGFDSKVIRIVKLWQLQSVTVVNISSKNMCTNDLSYCLCESTRIGWE